MTVVMVMMKRGMLGSAVGAEKHLKKEDRGS